ncbi:extracellular matrix regulator RemB [Saliterribacillus persicus]|uniref:Uncharacterized protein DUF370 n=1 Tax=Saliterribacillus persicus TaxID=930114 RepID=A0A368XA50_9BACI|nr:extracellular matrix/biofilm biosynthesis regulator RemA family protein [Saliterribacillus persicus]RCW64579.1 uncharacterized protein DUF370 [Saliterribacillus persicus]
MFIHIGDDHVIRSEEVVGIIDYAIVNSSTINDQMLTNLHGTEKLINEKTEGVKSIVITTNHMYYSPLSVLTLKKRASMISTISKLEDYSEISEEM